MLATLARVILTRNSGVGADQVVNDFVFKCSGVPDATDFANLGGHLENFYNDVATGATNPLRFYYSRDVSRDASVQEVRFYNIPDSPGPLGSPDGSFFWTFGAREAVRSIPDECAVVMGLNADLTDIPEESGSTRPRARRRGRLFLGPLNENAMSQTNAQNDPQRVVGTMRLDVIKAAQKLAIDALVDTWDWGIWSRQDWAWRHAVRVRVDNAFDTMRSRGSTVTASDFGTL